MIPTNPNELIRVLVEYVALLEKEVAAGTPVAPADIAKGTELKAQIAKLKNS